MLHLTVISLIHHHSGQYLSLSLEILTLLSACRVFLNLDLHDVFSWLDPLCAFGRNITEGCWVVSLQPVRCHVSLICPTVDGVHLYHLVKLLSVKFLYCRIIIFSLCNKYFVGNTLKMYKNSIPHQNSSFFNLFVSIWTHICLFYSVCYNQFISLWWCSICSQCSQ